MTTPRARLLSRLYASEPRLIRLLAPAGYGKSSLARLFARRFERHAICDCHGTSGVVDFASRALCGLAGEAQGGSDLIATTRLRLHATEADAATWSRALLEVWKSRQEHALLVLEHAEAIAENSGVLALLGDMLAARPAERVILISSRTAPPLRYAHYLAPYQMLTLSRDELRFDSGEAASMFEGSELAPEIVHRIVRLADGWPIVLLLLALFAQYDSNIERLLDRLDAAPANDLYESLANEVLSAFTPELMSAILATAAIPNASLEDISAATGIRHATPIVDRLLNLPGFISSETGWYHMHPLLRSALRARDDGDCTNYLLRAADHYERSGDYLRAAELYGVSGDQESAAAALNLLPPAALAHPSSRLIEAILHTKMTTLCAHPNLWTATLPYRRQRIEPARLYDEALRLLRSVASDAEPALHRSLRVRLATLALEQDKLSDARALLEDGSPADEEPEERRIALMTLALVAAKQGRFTEAEELVDECDAVHGARHLRFESERAQIAVARARLLGDWYGALKTSEETLYAAQRSGITSRIADAARAVLEAAWYCNDDARALTANEMLDDCGDPGGAAALDSSARAPHLARLHAALSSADARRASDLLDQAIEGIDTLENAFLRITIRVCAALLLPGQRRRLLEARTIAQSIESPPLQASLELLIDSPEPSDYGIFKHIAERIARSPLKLRKDVLSVDVVRGQVARGAETVHVSDRGFELIAALALLPPGTSKEELAAAIWPGLDGDAGLNTLKMCVSRTRAQIADKEAIRSTKRGYALSESVTIDVREFERLLRSIRGADALGDPTRRRIEDAIRALEARERTYTLGWLWFAPHAAHLEELKREFAMALAKDAFRRDDARVEPYAGVSTSNSS